MKSCFTQIAVTGDADGYDLFALDDLGDVWKYHEGTFGDPSYWWKLAGTRKLTSTTKPDISTEEG